MDARNLPDLSLKWMQAVVKALGLEQHGVQRIRLDADVQGVLHAEVHFIVGASAVERMPPLTSDVPIVLQEVRERKTTTPWVEQRHGAE